MLIERTALVWLALGLAVPALIDGWRGLLWGGFVRMAIHNHAMFAVNSVCHAFGSQPFATGDESRNNRLIAVLAFGEGWHNNHHAFPAAAYHGMGAGRTRPGWSSACWSTQAWRGTSTGQTRRLWRDGAPGQSTRCRRAGDEPPPTRCGSPARSPDTTSHPPPRHPTRPGRVAHSSPAHSTNDAEVSRVIRDRRGEGGAGALVASGSAGSTILRHTEMGRQDRRRRDVTPGFVAPRRGGAETSARDPSRTVSGAETAGETRCPLTAVPQH